MNFKYLIIQVLMLCYIGSAQATHLMGGSMTYTYTGSVGGFDTYHVILKIYRYCDASAGGTAPLDPSMYLGIYEQDVSNPNGDKNWFSTENLILTSSQFIDPPAIGPTCNFSTTVCVQEGVFEADISLPPSAGGYHMMVERCCRNGNIINLSTPGSVGQTYYCFIPPAPIVNSTPQFSDLPVPYMCTNDTISIVNNAFDPDGDSLVYTFATPFGGFSSSSNPVPDPQFDNDPYAFPIVPVLYTPGYSTANPFSVSGYSSINSQTGLTQYMIPNQGFYVVAIEIKEYRNGVLISSIRRDLQIIAIACPPNNLPLLSNQNGSGTINYTITEGQTICFPVTFTDPDGDSLYLSASGSIFNSAVTNPPASFSNASGKNIVTSQFCWSTDCGQAQAAPYQFSVAVTDNGCPPKTTNVTYSIKVNPSPNPPAPDVTISMDPPGPICAGTAVTFTAIPTFGGTNPVYQWQLNGVPVGANSNTWTSSTLNDGDVVTVTMTSNSTCVSTFVVGSPPVVVSVNPFPAPSVAITSAPPWPVCAGTPVTFTAIPVNAGASPTYQWSVNGINAGTNSTTFTTSTLTTGNLISVDLTSNAACPAATSNVIQALIDPVVTPSVTITANTNSAICPGENVTFTAFPTNGGTAPSYQWQVNGTNAGGNSSTFSTTTLNNGDIVTVTLTSSENCVTTPTANSNQIAITVTAPSAPSVSISVSPAGPICQDDNVIFNATTVLGGAAPSYQWMVNGFPTAAPNSPTWATSTLTNGDKVSVVLTSSLLCAVPATATSNEITMTVIPVVPASVTIGQSPAGARCPGELLTFTASAGNGGSNPSFQWQVNGVNTGANNAVFATSTLSTGDMIRVTMTSNGTCVSPLSVTSNIITVTLLGTSTPSVSITQNPAWPVCAGTPVTFTATPVAAGLNPSFQWTVNGVAAGGNSTTFTTSGLNDNDIVRVTVNSSAACPVPPSALSNSIVADINPTSVPAVTIAANPNGIVCAGVPINFTSIATNPGSNPIYRWRVNGVVMGTGATFSSSTLSDGDTIDLRLISDALCANPVNAYSNKIGIQIQQPVNPAVSIALTPPGTICSGAISTLTATSVNGGSNPVYNWFLNGTPFGSNTNVISGTFQNKDTLMVVMTSNYFCLTEPTDTSNQLILTVNPNVTPAVSIVAAPNGPYCPNDLVTFTATPVNGGTAPVYQWLVNGNPTGSNSATFSSVTLADGDVVTVQLTSSAACLTAPTANAVPVQVQVAPTVIPNISISVIPASPVCDEDTLFFSSLSTGGGPGPVVSWFVNGVASGAMGNLFTSNQLNNGDIITAVLTSNVFCASPLSDTSNQLVVNEDPLLIPAVSITANPAGIFCDGTVITYVATPVNGGNAPGYSWTLNGQPLMLGNDTITSSAFQNNDTLQVIMSSSERCLRFNPANSNEIVIKRYPPLLPVVDAPDEICYGQSATLEVNVTGGNGGPYYYSWDQGLTPDPIHFLTPQATTTYTVTVSDSCSVPKTVSQTITVHPLPEVAFTPEPVVSNILYPYYKFKDHSTFAYSWFWDFGDGAAASGPDPEHSYLEPGIYSVLLVVGTEFGCIDSARESVILEDVVIYYMPNSFTPNGDGINEVFGPTGHSVTSYSLDIFNRWGQRVFSSPGGVKFWDGNYNGAPVPEGVYVYVLQVENDPLKRTLTGKVTLVR